MEEIEGCWMALQSTYKPFSRLRNNHCKNSPCILKPADDVGTVRNACSEEDKTECNSSVKNISFKPCTTIFCFLKKKIKINSSLSISNGQTTMKVEGSKILRDVTNRNYWLEVEYD